MKLAFWKKTKTMEHLGNVLCMLADLDPCDQCDAYVNALNYYNKHNPEHKIYHQLGFNSYLLTSIPGFNTYESLTNQLKFHYGFKEQEVKNDGNIKRKNVRQKRKSKTLKS